MAVFFLMNMFFFVPLQNRPHDPCVSRFLYQNVTKSLQNYE